MCQSYPPSSMGLLLNIKTVHGIRATEQAHQIWLKFDSFQFSVHNGNYIQSFIILGKTFLLRALFKKTVAPIL